MKSSNFAPTIMIRSLQMPARIGVHDWERTEPQPVVVDLDVDVAPHRACETDRLEDTVDYARLIERLRGAGMQPHTLAEALGESMCASVLAVHGVRRVRLTLLKLAPFPGALVGVTLEREATPSTEFT
ncbi:dihydroneopterin aldolase [Ramlibacter sp.]|uniref:dihydroneopterin aldolase n=1 Tax=Ramlibacter sp. TaxID=1917967 RepID=UPI003D0BFA71